MGLSCTLPLICEFVEMDRVVPSAPVAVMVTEVAFVVCQLNVMAVPEAMLLLLADKVTVGAAVVCGLAEFEPQPTQAMRGRSAATPSRGLNRIAEQKSLRRFGWKTDCSRRFLRIPRESCVVAACAISIIRREPSKVEMPTRTVPRPFFIYLRLPNDSRLSEARVRE